MRKDLITKGFTVILLLAFFTAGCKKDELTPEDLQSLSFNSEEVLALVPEGLKNSTDPYAQSCVDYIESAVDMSGFISNLEVPSDAVKSSKKSTTGKDTWQWSWYYGGESFTFYWTYDEDNAKRYWTMEIQFNNGPRYDYITAWESKDGTEGEVIYNFGWAAIYSTDQCVDDYDFIYWRYSWNKDCSGAYHLKFTWDSDDPECDMYLHYDAVINADGSGTIDYYLMDQLFYHMEWDTVGNGSWTYYSDGTVIMSGSWTAV
jgi:hypothetical protein